MCKVHVKAATPVANSSCTNTIRRRKHSPTAFSHQPTQHFFWPCNIHQHYPSKSIPPKNNYQPNMSSIIKAVTDIFASVIELFWSFFTTAGTLVQKTAQFALTFVTEILDLVVNFFRGLVDLAGGLVSFILGNVLMLAVAAAAVFGFLQYQRSQGRTVQVGNKKLN
ncbi:hypothetical protein IAQ61_003282 [Plenodomus lingam]|nr:hypothetical protein IAQ61_003282 [Plenodomus lingam]